MANESSKMVDQSLLLRLVFDSVQDYSILTLDPLGHITSWNAGAERIKGYKASEIIGKHFSLFYSDDAIRTGLPQRELEAATQNGRFEEVNWHVRKDGSKFWANVVLTALRQDDGELIGFSRITRDLTERRRLEGRFQATVESAPMAIVMTNSQGAIVLVNAETEKLFGYSRDDIMGQMVDILVPERFRKKHPEHRGGYMSNPGPRRMGEGRDLYGRRKNGSEFPVEIGLNPINTEEGLFVLSVITDISQRKKQEVELKKLIERLDESNRELERFAYVVSHDLQEPLRKVASCCQALAEDYGNKLDADAKEWISFAVDGATRMRQMISDLLEFSRISTHGDAVKPTDAHEACQRALDNLEDSIEERKAEIICRRLPAVLADSTQLVQVFQNLIGNSLKYCEKERPMIEIGTERQGPFWKFYVKDNGIGIAPEFHDRIFQLFQRLHRKEDYAGTGIGLSICKKVVERLGGQLWVESQVGQGSTFLFTIPAVDSESV